MWKTLVQVQIIEIVDASGPVSYTVRLSDGRTCRRHTDHLQVRHYHSDASTADSERTVPVPVNTRGDTEWIEQPNKEMGLNEYDRSEKIKKIQLRQSIKLHKKLVKEPLPMQKYKKISQV